MGQRPEQSVPQPSGDVRQASKFRAYRSSTRTGRANRGPGSSRVRRRHRTPQAACRGRTRTGGASRSIGEPLPPGPTGPPFMAPCTAVPVVPRSGRENSKSTTHALPEGGEGIGHSSPLNFRRTAWSSESTSRSETRSAAVRRTESRPRRVGQVPPGLEHLVRAETHIRDHPTQARWARFAASRAERDHRRVCRQGRAD